MNGVMGFADAGWDIWDHDLDLSFSVSMRVMWFLNRRVDSHDYST